jgi:glyoxylase-like metal-dependent hydrolase (beta-lactamase superfamily II)
MRRIFAALIVFLVAAAVPASAQVSFVGDWSGRYHEDQPDRVPGEEPGDFSGIPINEAARRFGDAWDVARHSVIEHQCAPYTLPYMFFGPNQFRIWEERHPDSQELIAIQMYMGTYQQRRTIWMDGRPHPPDYAPYTFMGFSTGEWTGDILTITTTHIKAGYFRRTGVPASDRLTVVEHWMRHGNVLSQVTIATDPVYLTEPYVRSQEFVMMERGNTNWLYNCTYVMEVPTDKNRVPHYLPGENPWKGEFSARHAMPEAGVRGGAETLLPGWKPGDKPAAPRPNVNGGFRPEVQPSKLPAGEVRAVHVQGNVHMIVGAGANIAVQVGEDGVLVVDTGDGKMTDKVLAAVRSITPPGGEIRWVVNTTSRPEHTGGNGLIAQAGRTVNGNIADIVAHENVAMRMVEAKVAESARPVATYFEERRDFPFNGEPVVLYHPASANTDTQSMVMFRRSDVIVTGPVLRMDAYPLIEPDKGGSIEGTIAALNLLLDLTVPSKSFQQGGTFVIPAHGRICDEHEVLFYRDMLFIIRDRIKAMVDKKMTLEQVKAARPTLDYDGRYDTPASPAATLIEAIYREFNPQKPAQKPTQKPASASTQKPAGPGAK